MNKKIIILSLILLVVLGISPIKGQEYQSVIGNENFKWSIPVTQLFGVWVDELYIMPTENDYYEIWFNGQWTGFEPIYYGKMRSSENNSKLYYLAPESQEEELIMDLNMNVGDVFQMKNIYNEPYTMYVTDVYEKDGLRHVQFDEGIGTWSNLSPMPKMFIEKIGPNFGFGLSEFACTPYYFICKQENGEICYQLDDSYIKNCDFIQSSINEDEFVKESISIYPNPVDDKVTVEGDNIKTITVYNIIGQEIETIKVDNETKKDITISSYENGVYIFRINTIDGNSIQKRIVIAH